MKENQESPLRAGFPVGVEWDGKRELHLNKLAPWDFRWGQDRKRLVNELRTSPWPSLLASEHGVIPIEAKSSDRVTAADGRSVETFMAEHPDAAKVGLVVYPGNEVVELRRNVWGVPDWYLLGAL